MYQATLKNGWTLKVDRAAPEDAAELLQFLKVGAGESPYLASGPGDFEISVPAESAWLAGRAQGNSVTLRGCVDGRIMATASLEVPTKPRIAHTGEVSILVGQALWGQGAGTAMMEALLTFARKTGRIRLLHLGVRADNARALRLYQRMGFKQAGRVEKFFCVDGRFYDELLMTLAL